MVEQSGLVGMKAWLPVYFGQRTVPPVWVAVLITDKVEQWGHTRVRVCPIAGKGTTWVAFERLSFTEPENGNGEGK